MPAHAGETLAVAHFLDEMYAERPAHQVEASPWYEAAGSLARKLLHQRLRPAPKVGGNPYSSLNQIARECRNPARDILKPMHSVPSCEDTCERQNLPCADLCWTGVLSSRH